MPDPPGKGPAPPTGEPRAAVDPGLCSACAHARSVRSGRGSTFWLCGLAETDPSFPRYPRLPVRVCAGYRDAADPPA